MFWSRLWEVERGQMSAPGQIAVAAAQLPFTLTILHASIWFAILDQVRHELIHLRLYSPAYLQANTTNSWLWGNPCEPLILYLIFFFFFYT